MDEYPGFDSQRKKFISEMKDAIEERKETTRNRITGGYCILGLIILCLLILVALYLTHNLGFYDGLNKGIYILNCGFEFVGDFGIFCNV